MAHRHRDRASSSVPACRCVFVSACVCVPLLQACVTHQRYKQRVGANSPITGRASGGGSAFTSYIAAADLQQAISKYRASGCSEAYYLLTAGACVAVAAGSGWWCAWLCLCPG